MMKTTLVLSGLALASAKVDWMSICTNAGDVARVCPGMERGETYACLAEEYKKDGDLSALTFPCKDAMFERSQEAREQAMETAQAEQEARAQIAAIGDNWFNTCTTVGDVARVCPGMEGNAAYSCLATEFQRGEDSSLDSQCAGAILARSEASRAETIKELWKTRCLSDIAQLCAADVTSNADKIRCMGKNLAQVSDACVDALKKLHMALQAEKAETLQAEAEAAEAAGTSAEVLVPPPVMGTPVMATSVAPVMTNPTRPATPMAPPSGFAGVVADAEAEVSPVATKPKPKGKGMRGKGMRGKGMRGKGKGKGGKPKAPVCPMVSSFTAGTCPRKIRLGFGIKNGNCQPVMGCANQKQAARKAKFFKGKFACKRALKKC